MSPLRYFAHFDLVWMNNKELHFFFHTVLSRRLKGIHVVTPDWLWACAERWEKVEEKLFPLGDFLFL